MSQYTKTVKQILEILMLKFLKFYIYHRDVLKTEIQFGFNF